MTIKETTAALRQIANEMSTCKNPVRMVRLSDRQWDLEARYAALLRASGFDAA